MIYKKRVDANHSQIATALRQMGAFVVDTSAYGEGVPDMWVTSNYWTGWLEVKNPERTKKARLPRANQQAFLEMANKHGKHAHIVLTTQQAIRIVFGESVNV